MMNVLVALLFFSVASLVSLGASAYPGGIAGYTGKPSDGASQGNSCNDCHAGGTAPQVSITGPNTLAAGQTGDYSLVVTTSQSVAAGGVAATDGVVLTPGSGLRDSFGELVQDGPLPTSGGKATFAFKVTAPLTGDGLKLWAVGLASNGRGTGGDKASQTTKDVTVTGGAVVVPATDAGAPSGGSSSGGSSSGGAGDGGGGVASSNSSSTGQADALGAGGDGGAESSRQRLRSSLYDDPSCSMHPSRRSKDGAFAAAPLMGIGLLLRRRWRTGR